MDTQGEGTRSLSDVEFPVCHRGAITDNGLTND